MDAKQALNHALDTNALIARANRDFGEVIFSDRSARIGIFYTLLNLLPEPEDAKFEMLILEQWPDLRRHDERQRTGLKVNPDPLADPALNPETDR